MRKKHIAYQEENESYTSKASFYDKDNLNKEERFRQKNQKRVIYNQR